MVSAYILGSIPTSYLMGKIKGIDVRKAGSGNVGATNVLRTVGKLPALITLIVDILKGVLAVTFIATYFYNDNAIITIEMYRTLLGLCAVCGHNWSFFLKFKGGKGVATSCGVLGILMPKAMIAAVIIFFITLAFTKYVSLASLHLVVALPVVAALMGDRLENVLLAITICIIISYKHKSNIKRLLAGNENKIGAHKN
ncbi:MAG: glycerol-3-phosphate 1-O-acyltransferase PlsY [Candidatus Omnitrophica bacterium]|nr:glycerol-3-phosphate 1-O-acyltransferase PlsY [Candidatus Omnitrophota bacterium]